MFDSRLRPLIDPPLTRLGRALAARGITANGLTLAAFALGALTVPALAWHQWGLALALVLANRLLDGLDGAVARATRSTDLGGFLDIVCDFLFYALVPVGFALADPAANGLPAAVLIASFVGTGTTFLAHAIVAERHGRTTEAQGRKSFYYMSGLMEGGETVAFLIAFCLWPTGFPLLAGIMAALCAVSTAGRVWLTTRTFGGT
ncbi:CDP-alcohol phosphatidyltransferase family protein [Roseospira marina]|uniref:CDP-alcohol phosphatidyltransferase family protein n=1 Tax=Roseospira marina TaxID=140057 RepID=A0A5M6IBF7_9PROT|nr:CDP-alcohol phosphatidyltransferase family protein [Roseospira marina]KAA5605634.1 CDP-alcohol phosphatidyltransferase family protein [Roseospira marina]MBB4313292.1 phosphatidylglycerophosphate synthase [Roseospira marina]MBB5085967.1 phosphatidylglycerophosphate synthase [Roseospira marina]